MDITTTYKEENIVRLGLIGGVRSLLDHIKVEDVGSSYYVSGIQTRTFIKQIEKYYGTTRITKWILDDVTRYSFKIRKFFIPDLYYLIDNLGYVKYYHTPSRTIKLLKDELLEKTWLNDTLGEKPDILDFKVGKLFVKTPMPKQIEFFQAYNDIVPRYGLNGFMLAGTPGSGKTFMGLYLSEALKTDVTLIICPKNAVYSVWAESIKEDYHTPKSYWIADSAEPYAGQRYLIVHYEALSKVIEVTKKLSINNNIVIDECHNLNELSSMRTQLVIEICKNMKSRHVLWASGTPIKAVGKEVIPFFTTTDPRFDKHTALRFSKIFGANQPTIATLLKNRLTQSTFKIEKKDLNLEDPIMQTVRIKTPNAEKYTLASISAEMVEWVAERKRYYEDRKEADQKFFEKCLTEVEYKIGLNGASGLRKYLSCLKTIQNTSSLQFHEIKEELEYCKKYEREVILPNTDPNKRAELKNVLPIIKYVNLKILGECLGRVLGRRRIDATLELSRNVDYSDYIESSDGKTLIYSTYVEAVEAASERCLELKYAPLVVTGANTNELSSIIKLFDENKKANPLVATYASLSTAVRLTTANIILLLNSPFRDHILQQTISRAHRIGQTRQVYVYVLQLDTGEEPNITSRSVDILKWSQSQIEEILGIKSPYEINIGEESGTVALEEIVDTLSGKERVAIQSLNIDQNKKVKALESW
jgi:superfamily II DNA or RNA helicase